MTNPALAKDRDEQKKGDNTAAIIGGIAAIGLGIAIATADRHGDDHRHDNDWDGNLYGDAFSPANNVVCVPNPRKCHDRGHFSYSWTKRIFGISAGLGDSDGSWDGGFGGSGGSRGAGQDFVQAQQRCMIDAQRKGLRNVTIENVEHYRNIYALVYMQVRRSPMTVNHDRWCCDFKCSTGLSKFKQI
ncbi:MAG: hypothetical protein ACK4IS_06750 [Erythrobacter sp.]